VMTFGEKESCGALNFGSRHPMSQCHKLAL